MSNDRAKHNILPPSRFGVVEITRQRVRPETDINTSETCPTCNGTGEVQASILYAEEIENNLHYLISERKVKKLTLQAHPYLESYFKCGMFSRRFKWFLKYKKWIPVRGLSSYHLLQYEFVDENKKPIKL
jgi:ribonuclease G